MIYKKSFINGLLKIKLKTNRRYIYRLIDNYLDFNNCDFNSNSKNLTVEFQIDKVNYSLFNHCLFDISMDDNAKIVKGRIYRYQRRDKETILDSIFMQPLYRILMNHRYFFLHSAVLVKHKQIVFIIGPQDSGKSTISIALYKKGFHLLADDKCFLKTRKGKIFLLPFPTKVGITDKNLARNLYFKKHILKNYRYGSKLRFSLGNIYKFNHLKSSAPKMIIFPKYKSGNNLSIKALSKKEAFYSLLKENLVLFDKKRHSLSSYLDNFSSLTDFIDKLDAYELTYNDKHLDKIADIIQKVGKFNN